MSPPSDPWMRLEVRSVASAADGVLAIELAHPQAGPLGTWSPGAHVDIEARDDEGRPAVRQYSLCGAPDAPTWSVAVLADGRGRGASRWLHRNVQPGTTLTVRGPRNHFQLEADTRPVVLVAGGIGITPLMAMAQALHRQGRAFRLHYHVRSRAGAAFLDALQAGPYAAQVRLSVDDEQAVPVERIFDAADAEAWVYTCGPAGFMDAVMQAARGRGVPAHRIRRELFTSDPAVTPTPPSGGDTAFRIRVLSTGQEIEVPAGESAVKALARAGIEVTVSCEQGHCGSCLTRVVEGLPDHRDQFMLPEEHERNDAFTPCCSRALSPCLVLDL